jgi:oxygen-independent coproporphyrinogen-3 oxidase
VHVPFCVRRCPYCDFDFVVGRTPDTAGYLAALSTELASRRDELTTAPTTLYLGGGTPSALGTGGLSRLLELLSPWCPGPVREATVELNPEHVDNPLVAMLRAHGIDRVSLGVQSFDGEALAQLGRSHDASQAERAVELCLHAGLRTSIDLIVGYPGQTRARLDADLAKVIGLQVGHVSIYALTIERGTPWPRLVRRGLRQLPDDDAQADMLSRTHDVLGEAGLQHYEVASHARPGERAIHNGLYWAWQDYVGVGPSAASATYGDDGSVARRTNARGLAAWAAGGAPQHEVLDGRRAAAEGLWLGLRTFDGVHVADFLRRFPQIDRAWLARKTDARVERGDLERTDERLRLGRDRWLVLDGIAADLVDPDT